VFKVRMVLLGENPCLKGEPRGKGRKGDKGLIFADDTNSLPYLLVHDVAEDTAFLVLEIVPGALNFLTHAPRNDGEGDELGMGVFQGGACSHAVVLEDEDIAEPWVTLEVGDPFAVGPEHVLHCFGRKSRQRLLMERGFNQNLMGSDPVHLVVDAFPLTIQFSFDSKGREFVRNNPETPSRRIRRCSVASKGEDLWRSFVLVSLAQGTESTDRLMLFDDKIGGPSPSFCGDDDPPSVNGIFSQLRHSLSTRFDDFYGLP
jgi:hypothetical protein